MFSGNNDLSSISQDANGVITRNYGNNNFNYGGNNGSMNGLGRLFNGLFGNSAAPYEAGGKTLKNYLNQAQNVQNPFMNAGTAAIPQLQQWLQGMQDPSGFINHLMGNYQQSPWAKYQQEQSSRRYGNAGSESGLTGSTPLEQFE